MEFQWCGRIAFDELRVDLSHKSQSSQSHLNFFTSFELSLVMTLFEPESRHNTWWVISSHWLSSSIRAATSEQFRGQKSLLVTIMTSSMCSQPWCDLFAMISLPLKREQMMINWETRKLQHDYAIITNPTLKDFFIIAVAFLKFSDENQ